MDPDYKKELEEDAAAAGITAISAAVIWYVLGWALFGDGSLENWVSGIF